ncbi:MAG: site-2 protease family protein [Actinomycetota bacterium]|nr:site-2 protease family protein [Actinomycetota bacterium]
MPARAALTLFHVRGIRVGVDYSWFFVLFLVILWLSGYYEEVLGDTASDSLPYVLAAISAFAFFGSILLHELGHAVVAMRYGIPITEITLWLFGGVAQMARDTDSPRAEFRIAAAGPAVTLLIALACTALGVGLAGSEQGFVDAMMLSEGADISASLAVLAWLVSINVLVLVFNLIPAFPLDGGRIARAVAWKLTGDRHRATSFAAILGQGFSYLFIAIGVLLLVSGAVISGIWLALIGFLLGSSARGAAARSAVTSRLVGLTVADVMDGEPVAIAEDVTVERALEEYFLRYQWPWFPVIDQAQRFVGLLVRESADAVPEEARLTRRVGETYEPDATGTLRVRDDAPLESVLGNASLGRFGALAAVDQDGVLRGIITRDQVGRALRDALRPPPAGEVPG